MPLYLPSRPHRRRVRTGVPFIFAIVAAACSSGTEPVGEPEGSLSFAYTGEIEGTFDVTGAFPPPGQDCEACAYASPSVQGDRLLLAAHRRRGDVFDRLIVTIANPSGPGRYEPELVSDAFVYGVPTLGVPEYRFRFDSGEVVVTALDDARIQGEFRAEGEHFDLGAGPPGTLRVEIVDGAFDLPILRR
jgi:hypothetical protein